MKGHHFLAVVVSITLVGAAASAAEQVTYRVTVEGTWTAASHPYEYPRDAHFSWLTGATHDASYRLFEAGSVATPGLEALAEDGELSPYDAEIRRRSTRTGPARCFRPGRSSACRVRPSSTSPWASAIRWSRSSP